jgi:hypothetical protein
VDDAANEKLSEANPIFKGRGCGHTLSGSRGGILRRGMARR